MRSTPDRSGPEDRSIQLTHSVAGDTGHCGVPSSPRQHCVRANRRADMRHDVLAQTTYAAQGATRPPGRRRCPSRPPPLIGRLCSACSVPFDAGTGGGSVPSAAWSCARTMAESTETSQPLSPAPSADTTRRSHTVFHGPNRSGQLRQFRTPVRSRCRIRAITCGDPPPTTPMSLTGRHGRSRSHSASARSPCLMTASTIRTPSSSGPHRHRSRRARQMTTARTARVPASGASPQTLFTEINARIGQPRRRARLFPQWCWQPRFGQTHVVLRHSCRGAGRRRPDARLCVLPGRSAGHRRTSRRDRPRRSWSWRPGNSSAVVTRVLDAAVVGRQPAEGRGARR